MSNTRLWNIKLQVYQRRSESFFFFFLSLLGQKIGEWEEKTDGMGGGGGRDKGLAH